jgi:hypothetical protein
MVPASYGGRHEVGPPMLDVRSSVPRRRFQRRDVLAPRAGNYLSKASEAKYGNPGNPDPGDQLRYMLPSTRMGQGFGRHNPLIITACAGRGKDNTQRDTRGLHSTGPSGRSAPPLARPPLAKSPPWIMRWSEAAAPQDNEDSRLRPHPPAPPGLAGCADERRSNSVRHALLGVMSS